jgi:hypothetical protein
MARQTACRYDYRRGLWVRCPLPQAACMHRAYAYRAYA